MRILNEILKILRLKFRRNAGSTASKAKLDKLTSSVTDIEVKIKVKEAERENIVVKSNNTEPSLFNCRND